MKMILNHPNKPPMVATAAKGPTPAAVEKAKKVLEDADKAEQKQALETFAADASELRHMRTLAASARKEVEAAKTGPAFKEYDKARAELMKQVAELDAQHLENVEAVEKTYKEGLLAAVTKAKEVAVQQAALIDAGLVPKLNKSQLGALGWGYSLARINFNAADLTAKPTVAAPKKA